ncbi:MAG: hypothetical protein H0V53_05845 [Rubrobacter sp.]|nr:hypothetical protein [Rubrobacter sp.]
MLVVFVLVSAGACSSATGTPPEEEGSGDAEFPEGTVDFSRAGPATTPEPGAPETLPEGTTDTAADQEEPVLRLEGGPEAEFSGICNVGGEEYVIGGETPSSYDDFGGQSFSCQIEKQDSGDGGLKVIVATGDTTRSVQQTSTEGSIISISHDTS